MVGAAIGLLGGICGVFVLTGLPPWPAVLVAASALAGAGLARCQAVLVAAGLGLVIGYVDLDARLADRLDDDLEGRTLTVRGLVVSVPQQVTHGIRFRLSPEPDAGVDLPGTIELTWYDPSWIPRAAERVALEVRLRRPRGFANPGGADYAARMLRERIGATGYVRGGKRQGRDWRQVLAHPLLVARGEIAEAITSALGARPASGIVAGLAVGLQDALSPEQWRALARSGTSHLMAISGLHIGMVAAIAAWLAGAVQRARQRRGALGTVRDAAVTAGVAAAIAYSALAGWSVPTQRTALMIAIAGLALRQRRRAGVRDGLALAAIGVLVLHPFAVLAPGFWLSFGAVAAIAFAAGGYVARPALLAGYARVQLAVTIGLVPILIGSFGNVSLVSVAVNLAAIPLYTLIIVPAVLVATALVVVWPTAGAAALEAVAWLIEATWPLIDAPAALRWASWSVATLPPYAWAALLGATVAALAPLPAAARAAALAIVGALCLWRPSAPAPGAARVSLLDVGQGLSAVVETRRHVLVYDTGPRFRSGSDAGLLAVAPYLRHRGIRAIDLLVVSHDDSDHAGGADSLLATFAVRARTTSGAALGPEAPRCRRGTRWSWDGVEFEWLHPGAVPAATDNDRSCVLRIRAAGRTVLLTGDIEADAEREMLHAMPPGPVDILIVPHHGSRTSSTPAFVDATRPRWALVSAGHRNQWRFPAQSVVERWRAAGASVLVTSETGAIEFELDAGSVSVPRLARSARARPWD